MSVFEKKVKSGESPKFYKSGISRLEDRLAAVEHFAYCCAEEEKEVSFKLTANAGGTGNWQVIPAGGHQILAAPGAGKTYLVTGVVTKFNVSVTVDAGGGEGTFAIFANGETPALSQSVAPGTGVKVNVIAQATANQAVLGNNSLNKALMIDHLSAGAPAVATGVGTADIKVFYKVVSI